MSDNILEVRDLRTSFYTEEGVVRAANGVNLEVRQGEILGLVGESGCGKSVTALSIMRLIQDPGRIEGGEILFQGQDLLHLSLDEMRHIRGNRISMIFQQPLSSLNPVFRVGEQVAEVFQIHQGFSKDEAWDRAVEMLKKVGIPAAGRRAHDFPHQMSGGMAQRVMIAMALATLPELLLADEPTTALDVTIQAQILDLMRRLQEDTGTSIILITHDLGVIADMADRVAVMYAGEVVEVADVDTLFSEPKHPYTRGLLASTPVLGQTRERLEVIPGNVPSLINMPPGCPFAPRCTARVAHSLEICTQEDPPLYEVGPEHTARCFLHQSQPGAVS